MKYLDASLELLLIFGISLGGLGLVYCQQPLNLTLVTIGAVGFGLVLGLWVWRVHEEVRTESFEALETA